MSPSLSVYLEVLRIAATLIVFVAHSLPLYEPFREFATEAKLGRDGVVFFFVLSGFVISWCASERDRSPVMFVINRAARIYSVAIPGIALGIAVSLLLRWIHSTPEFEYPLRKLWLYLPMYLTFTGTLWNLTEVPPQNFPYWSLNFEVWYYLLFAVGFYVRGRWRVPLLLLLAAIVGPEILLMSLLWLGGSALYFYGPRLSLARGTARAVFVLSIIGYLLTKIWAIDAVLDARLNLVWQAVGLTAFVPQQLLGDYWIGLLVMANIGAARHAGFDFSLRSERVIRFWASYSFSFYLFHIPMFALLGALLTARDSFAQYVAIMVLATGVILILGQISERRKNGYRKVFMTLAKRCGWCPDALQPGATAARS